ncbi:hypothetical protein [Mucilaginibacter sp.]|uniref:hypothetical protein n=1 Tax=Mucilaginibacter sp. TaxID=1882438 RepID=UPI00261F21F5|nr:hypothetical protein [Mucilaginibacter sp.]MDB4920128.1 hypothetical protein [Mucilaginibacter sp.]
MKTYIITLLSITTTCLFAQQKQVVHNYTLIKPSEWVIPKTDTLDYAFDSYSGAKALLLKRKFGNAKGASVAYPKALNFKDGTIEMDLASPGGKHGFVGFAFRIKDAHHYETLYFRPGSSGTINAVQYMPEKKAEFNWWDYEADKYQAKAILPLTAWFHVKAIVKGREISVFVNNQPKPVMFYKDLDPALKTGSVGFWLGNCSLGAYKNLVVNSSD